MVELPKNVTEYLRVARRRTNRLRRGRAVSVTLTVSLAVLAVAMAVDATVTIFDDFWRWALSFSVYLAAAGCAIVAAVRLVRGRPSLPQLARTADAKHPELQERLATLVDVVAREERGEATGASDALLALLAREADEQVEKYDCRREFPLGGLFLWALPWLALALLFAGAWMKRPDLTRCLAQRVLTPWVDTGNLYADRLLVEPGDLTVLADTNITISVKALADFGKRPFVRISRWTGTDWDRERAAPMGTNGVFETTADLAEPRWRYRVNVGPAVSRYYEVRVVPHPQYEVFTATIDWPAYTQLPPTVISNAEVSLVRSVVGSRVTFAVQAQDGVIPKFAFKDVAASPAPSNRKEVATAPSPSHRWQWVADCSVSNTVPWSLQMSNMLGFVEPAGRGLLETVPDRPPAVAVQAPREPELALPRRGRLPLVFTANDDFGIAAAELRVTVAGATNVLAARALKPEALEGTTRRLAHTLDLSDLDLDNIGAIQVCAVVRDACPPSFGGYHAATSTPIRVRIDNGAQDYVRQALDAAMKQAKEMQDEARRDLEQAFNKSNELRNDVRNDHGEYKDHSERKLEEISKLFEEALEKLKTLERSMEEDGRFDPVAESLRKMLEENMANAAQKLQQAQPGTENTAERAQAANELPEAMRQALDDMRPIEKQLDARGEDVKKLERLQGLAERQESLAQQAEARAQQQQAQNGGDQQQNGGEPQDGVEQQTGGDQQQQQQNAGGEQQEQNGGDQQQTGGEQQQNGGEQQQQNGGDQQQQNGGDQQQQNGGDQQQQTGGDQQQQTGGDQQQQNGGDQQQQNGGDQQQSEAERAAQEAADKAAQEAWRKAESELSHETASMSWHDDSPKVAEAARQMKAAVRRSKDEQKGSKKEGNDEWAVKSAQDKLKNAENALHEAQARREEAAKIEAAHAQREAEAAQAEAAAQQAQNGGDQQPQNGDQQQQNGGDQQQQAGNQQPQNGGDQQQNAGDQQQQNAGDQQQQNGGDQQQQNAGDQQQQNGDQQQNGEAGGEPVRKPLPYTDEERGNLDRLHNQARDQERRAAQLEREAADDLMRVDADESTRSALAEAIEALHDERTEAGEAFKEFQQARWNKRKPAPEGKNAELAKGLAKAEEKLKAAEKAVEMMKPESGTSAEAAREAADQLHQAVAAKRSQMGMQMEQEGSAAQQQQMREAPVDNQVRTPKMRPLPPKLRGILSQEEWIRIRAVLGDAESVDISRVPEEYRELVKRYFHILAGER